MPAVRPVCRAGNSNEAGAFPVFARHRFVNPLPPGRTARLTMQAVIHAALVEVKDGLVAELFEFALEEPPRHFAALAVFHEFFLA
jgi:acyl dehydratase